MGDNAEAMIQGDCCEVCGEFFDDAGDGYPRLCSDCGARDEEK